MKNTVESAIKHLEALDSEQGGIYETIARVVLDVAALQHAKSSGEFHAQRLDVLQTIELLMAEIRELKHPG